MMKPPVLWIGDDFTGATDTLATYAEAGWRARLFLDVPSADELASTPLDAIGIATAARALSPAAMAAALAPMAAFAAASGARVVHYKCCSTFDSHPELGSIGEAERSLRAALGPGQTLIVGGQPSLGRYCAFGHLFATAEAGGPAWRIDRHPTMSRHPSTPMHESDLRRHLALQGLAEIDLLDLRQLAAPPAASPAPALLIDAVEEAHLATIGALIEHRAAAAAQLVVGASSVAQALIAQAPRRATAPAPLAAARQPVLVFVGSLSPQSGRQIEAAASFERIALSGDALQGDRIDGEAQALATHLREGRPLLVHTRGVPATTASAGFAERSARLIRRIAELVPLGRLVIAGGDTSSRAIQMLAPTSLQWLARPAAGVALCRLQGGPFDGLEVLPKGGQMGGDTLFERLLHGDG